MIARCRDISPGLVLAFCLCVLWARDLRAEGVVWPALTLEQALAEAAKFETQVLVDVYSGHCGQCKTMDAEIWLTPEGAELTEGLVALRIATEEPAGQALQARYPITGLPAVLFLEPDGTEFDRIVGYSARQGFLDEARSIKSGVDQLEVLEAQLGKTESPVKLLVPLMQKHLYRKREVEAEEILERVLELDAENRHRQAELALSSMAKYHDYFKKDKTRSHEYWSRMVNDFPHASAISAAVKATCEYDLSRARGDSWIEWICGVARANPEDGRLAYAVSMSAHRSGLRHPCLAEAALTAHRLGRGPAYMDSIAVILSGEPGKPGGPGKPTKPKEPGKPEEPGKPAKLGKPKEPGKLQEPAKPGEPGKKKQPR